MILSRRLSVDQSWKPRLRGKHSACNPWIGHSSDKTATPRTVLDHLQPPLSYLPMLSMTPQRHLNICYSVMLFLYYLTRPTLPNTPFQGSLCYSCRSPVFTLDHGRLDHVSCPGSGLHLELGMRLYAAAGVQRPQKAGANGRPGPLAHP